jgi:ABC-2 type transport system permease protein
MVLGARFSPRWESLPLAFLTLGLFALGLAALSSALALRSRAPEVMGAFVHLVNMPLLFTSTALVPIREMPPWLAGIAAFNPLSLTVDALRNALLLEKAVLWHIPALLLLPTAGLFLLAWVEMRRMPRS